jgi:branched-chain amino acid transport system ATP-binding protein
VSAAGGADRPVLALEGVEAGYGPFRALFGVSLSVAPGTAVALVGANGAGKSSVARVASGLVTPTAGRVLVDGEDFTGRAPHEFARAGVAHAPEGRAVLGTLTVEDNLRLAFRNAAAGRDVTTSVAEAFELFPRLGERRAQRAGTLSGGEQRMLTLARVMVLRPRVLVADELSLGLAPLVTAEVYSTLERVRATGCALLVVEQHLDHALELADEVVVITKGEVTFTGTPAAAAELTEHVLPSGHPVVTSREAPS